MSFDNDYSWATWDDRCYVWDDLSVSLRVTDFHEIKGKGTDFICTLRVQGYVGPGRAEFSLPFDEAKKVLDPDQLDRVLRMIDRIGVTP